jgi:hypothetical protein
VADPKLYPDDLRPWDLEPHYTRHIGAMTAEGLHAKSDIAMQLAYRDKRIAELEQQLAFATPGGLAKLREQVLAYDFESGLAHPPQRTSEPCPNCTRGKLTGSNGLRYCQRCAFTVKP